MAGRSRQRPDHLHGVDDVAAGDQGLEGGHVVAVLEPVGHVLDVLGVRVARTPRPPPPWWCRRGPGRPRRARGAGPGRRSCRCGRPRRGRRGGAPPGWRPAGGRSAWRRCRRRRRRTRRRRAARGAGAGCRRSRAPVMIAERALGAHEELVEVGAHRGARRAAGGDLPTVGQGHVEAQHHVLDLPVAGGELAGRAAGQPAADGGQGHRLRPVAEGESVLGRAARARGGRRRCPEPRRAPATWCRRRRCR